MLLLFNYFLPDHGLGEWLKVHHAAEIVALTLLMVWPSSRYSLFFGMTVLFAFVLMPWFKPTQILNQQRNFYGIKQVFSQAGAHVLMNQSTLHGFQVQLDKKPVDGARGYYGSVYPVVQQLEALHQPLHAMILGLGTGVMACQFREQDKVAIVEIDKQVIDIASNPNLFTYLRDCPPQVSLIKDDGRLAVAKMKDASYELLVMDAFTSDAIPVHLLTLEAFTLYKAKITTDGVILVNITNRHLQVLPVLTGAGRELDMIVLHKLSSGNTRLGQFPSEWALLTSNERLAGNLLSKEGWRFVADAKTQLWTNDYSNLIPLLKW
jgi:spermidine synthase